MNEINGKLARRELEPIEVRPPVTVTSLSQRLSQAKGEYHRTVIAYERGTVTTGQLVDAALTMRNLQRQYEGNGS
jgi:hypothetical protein